MAAFYCTFRLPVSMNIRSSNTFPHSVYNKKNVSPKRLIPCSFSNIVIKNNNVCSNVSFESSKDFGLCSSTHSFSSSHRMDTVRKARCTDLYGRRRRYSVAASSETSTSVESQETVETFPKLKEFLEKAKKIGRVRIVVNTGLGVLESVTTLDGLFCREFAAKGEYANLMKQEENVDFHLLLNKVASVKLSKGPATFDKNITIHSIRFLDSSGTVGASVLAMWKPGTKGDYDEGQVEAFEDLLREYGEEIKILEETI